MPDYRAPLLLRCTVTLDGREYTAQQTVSRLDWEMYDAEYRKVGEAMLRRKLGEIIVNDLAPPVTVVEASPTGEAMHRAAMEELEG